jgi:hypothetical protein
MEHEQALADSGARTPISASRPGNSSLGIHRHRILVFLVRQSAWRTKLSQYPQRSWYFKFNCLTYICEET